MSEKIDIIVDSSTDVEARNQIVSASSDNNVDVEILEPDYEAAVGLFNKCNPEELSKEECQDVTFRMAMANMQKGDLVQAATWFRTLQYTGTKYSSDCVYYLAYIDYTKKEYDTALKGFLSLKGDLVYGELAPTFIGEIYLKQGKYEDAAREVQQCIDRYPQGKQVTQLQRILGEACYYSAQYSKAIDAFNKYLASTETPSREALYLLKASIALEYCAE
jgi:outer membrane protein assembly factor BamD (BamD/ComL family)